ncbi:phosphonate-binding protein [Brevundimonas vitis]|uniref:Phosphonate-binding protein n=1 Tax=Brevundimonas vitisensis TaxID=2800818 RepID=A0ABX7BIH0_9CAUL|nr:helicase-related protein [Brevundimonas vitisensis]QQQ17317.1 phosphonate-binding protein [Brevundimonas vitisensis]
MSDRSAGLAPSRVVAVLGPTNTGKTHLAVERMLGHASGMIGLPLRLLAREIYERIVTRRGANAVALITGEEKIVPPRAHYFVCTVEAMPLERSVEFLAVDEIQLVADPARGHVFTQRMLHARGRSETMFLGAGTMAPLMRSLIPDLEIVTRERLSTLSYAGSKKLTRLPRRSAIVAFSTDQVYAIAELIRRQRGGAAVVMGSLSPRTRNAQVALFQSGEVDFLVATDAIGMGLNMDVDHVAFAGLRKFDGRRTRWLHAHEIGQIAGRAGRHLRDGTFGVTGETEELDPDLVEQVVEHRFDPVEAAEWRNGRLDFDSLPDLLRSLVALPQRRGLSLSEQALDETLLRRLMTDEDIQKVGRSRGGLMRLWEACQLPDFEKTTLDEHARLAKSIFQALTGPTGRLEEDWIAPRFQALDREDGQIDQLSARLSGVRTLSYVANRPDWLRGAKEWRERTRVLEDRLSDVLHERLTARFVDRRTTALLRSLNDSVGPLADVSADGAVHVDGEAVGRLDGVHFRPETGGSALADRTLKTAALRAVGPEITRRLGRLAADDDSQFSVTPTGDVLWRGDLAARITGPEPFAPRVRLIGDLGPQAARERAQRRIEAWLAAEAGRALRDLRRLKQAVETGSLKGLPRGIAFRLIEAGGLIDRRDVARDLAALSQVERRTLRTFAIRVGTHSVWLPGLMKPRARAFALAFTGTAPLVPSSAGTLIPTPPVVPSARALSAMGLRHLGPWLAPVEALETLADRRTAAAAAEPGRPPRLTPEDLAALGWTEVQARQITQALKTDRARQPDKPGTAPRPVKDSPFAALAALTAEAPARKTQPRKPPRRRARPSSRPPA